MPVLITFCVAPARAVTALRATALDDELAAVAAGVLLTVVRPVVAARAVVAVAVDARVGVAERAVVALRAVVLRVAVLVAAFVVAAAVPRGFRAVAASAL